MEQTNRRSSNVDPVLRDIRSGMDEFSLKQKHGLSDEQLQSAYQRYAELPASDVQKKRMAWNCPACGFSQPKALQECPRCGIVVSKFSDRKRVDAECKSIRAHWQTETESSKKNPWVSVAATVFLCLILGGVLLKWTAGGRQDEAKIAQVPAQESSGLKKFTYENLQDEVVAVSRKQPVIVEFYSSH